jgi:hypothetical protein
MSLLASYACWLGDIHVPFGLGRLNNLCSRCIIKQLPNQPTISKASKFHFLGLCTVLKSYNVHANGFFFVNLRWTDARKKRVPWSGPPFVQSMAIFSQPSSVDHKILFRIHTFPFARHTHTKLCFVFMCLHTHRARISLWVCIYGHVWFHIPFSWGEILWCAVLCFWQIECAAGEKCCETMHLRSIGPLFD